MKASRKAKGKLQESYSKTKWKAKISLDDGLRQTFDWYLDNQTFFNSVPKKLHINRLGLKLKDYGDYIYPFLKNLDIKLVISHLISSEKKSVLNDNQLKLFNDIKKKFYFSNKTLFSLGNSNSIFLKNRFHFDLIRAGGFIYGLDLTKQKRSKNVLALKAKIIQIENVQKGRSIGYGAKYITKKDSLIATLAIGYADGLPRKYDGFVFYKKKK